MAQRTGADGLLGPLRRAASARAILALAASLVLLLAGCGGDSADETASVPSSEQAANATVQGAKGQEADPGSSPGKGSDSSGAAGGQGSGSGGGKQGPRPEIPKGEPEPGPSEAEEAQTTLASITLTSPAIAGGNEGALPAKFTCDGADSPPPLQWQGVPSGTQELILLAMSAAPVDGAVFFGWALAGIDPSLEGLEAGDIPAGAVQGKNSFGKTGYSICPPEGSGETYFFVLYALPEALSPDKGFDPLALREAALGVSDNAGILTVSYGG
jgi:phosphatidylethanolamine-binding protein (PEBP) family uncharacterized protein